MIKFILASPDEINIINEISNNKYPMTSIYVAGKDNDILVSYCVCRINNDYIELIDVKTMKKDDYLEEVTARAAFNMFDLGGIHKVRYEGNELHNLMEKLEFKKEKDNIYYLDLTDYFLPCSCKNKQK